MSDLAAFGPHHVLEHHIQEAIAFQWNGSKAQAEEITRELVREVAMRDADVYAMKCRLVASNTAPATAELTIGLARKSDGATWDETLFRGEWLVLELHEQRLYDVHKMSEYHGDKRFRRQRPIVVLRPGAPQSGA